MAGSSRALFALVIVVWLTPGMAQVSVTICHSDRARTGQNARQTPSRDASLVLTNGGVVLGLISHCDDDPMAQR